MRLDLIMPKYSLFIQHRERIKGSQITKYDLDLITHNPKGTALMTNSTDQTSSIMDLKFNH